VRSRSRVTSSPSSPAASTTRSVFRRSATLVTNALCIQPVGFRYALLRGLLVPTRPRRVSADADDGHRHLTRLQRANRMRCVSTRQPSACRVAETNPRLMSVLDMSLVAPSLALDSLAPCNIKPAALDAVMVSSKSPNLDFCVWQGASRVRPGGTHHDRHRPRSDPGGLGGRSTTLDSCLASIGRGCLEQAPYEARLVGVGLLDPRACRTVRTS